MRACTLLALLAVSLTACDSGSDVPTPTTFALLGADGEIRETGRLRFDDPIAPGRATEGDYEIVGRPSVPAEPEGRFDATCDADGRLEIVAGLIPDGGLFLSGGCAGDLGGGTWATGSLAGPLTQGRFEFGVVLYDDL